MLINFSFAFDTDTKQGTMAGNIEPQAALNLLIGLIIADAIKKANKDKEVEDGINRGTTQTNSGNA